MAGKAAALCHGRQDLVEAFGKSVVRAAGSAIGRQVIRGLLGGLFG